MIAMNPKKKDIEKLNESDFVVIVENDEDFYDFVTIDEDSLYDSVIIDISDDEIADSFVIGLETDYDTNAFVTIDDEIIVSGFFENDDPAQPGDFDLSENISL